jgi:hypothetical protein
MARKRPAAILVIAILNLLGGAWNLLVSLIACAGLVIIGSSSPSGPRPGTTPDMSSTTAYIAVHAPHYMAFSAFDVGLDFLLSILLVSAGIGLLLMGGWGRWLSLVYVPLSVISRTLNLVYKGFIVIPLISEFYQMGAKSGTVQPSAATGAKVGAIGAVIIQFAFILYPIVVAIVMLRPSTAKAFRAAAKYDRRDEEEEELNDYDDEPREYRSRDSFRE